MLIKKGINSLFKGPDYQIVCGGITIDALYDCDNPIVPGVDQRLILGNLGDIDTITFDLTIPTLITDITLLSGGKEALFFEGIRQSLNPQYSLIPATVSVGYDHQVDFLVFDLNQVQKENLEAMALTKLFAVVQNRNNAGNGDALFEVYGIGTGLELQTNVRIPSDTETGGAFSLSLKTSDNEGKEPKMPQNWFDTDFATTLAKVDALLTPTL